MNAASPGELSSAHFRRSLPMTAQQRSRALSNLLTYSLQFYYVSGCVIMYTAALTTKISKDHQ